MKDRSDHGLYDGRTSSPPAPEFFWPIFAGLFSAALAGEEMRRCAPNAESAHDSGAYGIYANLDHGPIWAKPGARECRRRGPRDGRPGKPTTTRAQEIRDRRSPARLSGRNGRM